MKTLQDNFITNKLPLIVTTLLLIFSLLGNSNVKAQCHLDDWTALKSFYESTNWNDTTGWHIVANHNSLPANCDLGSMNGITLHTILDSNPGRVKKISLRSKGLSGSIPPEIGDLTYLTNIDLHTNFLTGSIPTEIGNLGNLEYLTLSNNYLVGNLPTEIGYLTKLRGLHLDNSSWFLGNNQVTGNIPVEIGNLVNLKTLYLSRNNFTGSIPNSISNLTNLLDFYAEYNQLTGEIPEEIANLTDLKDLILYHNQLSDNLPDAICQLTNLEKVILTYNQLEGEIPECLGDLTNGNLSSLEHFDVSSNKLTGSIPPNFGNLTNLIHLAFSSNKLTGNIPQSIGSLVNMKNFGIGNNFIDGVIPQNFSNLSAIEKLWMDDNNLSGSIPAGLANLSNLTTVYFNGNNLSGAIPTFSNSSAVLRVQENYFSCSDIENFDKIQGQTFEFEPQYITPINYDNIKSYVIESTEIGTKTETLFPEFADTVNYTYQWKQNGETLNGKTSNSLTLTNIQPEDAGRYTLHIQDPSCAMGMEFVTDPIYVIVEGYDLYGQEVEYNQIMVEFVDSTKTNFYRDLILTPFGGTQAKACNCNRELYLWQYPTTQDATEALVIIDKKLQSIKDGGEPDGGFNNRITIGDSNMNGGGFKVPVDLNNNSTDEVTIFLLDTGLDENGDKIVTDYLTTNAPVDDCYNINTASGYNYTSLDTTINDNYTDEYWHGTFGYNSITDGLNQSDNITIVPLKIFDENGEGNLFDLTCAIYHAIDHDADIINLSAGYQGQRSSILENAINTARENGVFICTAAGNDTINIDVTPQYPAYFASQYHYIYDTAGEIVDSFKYNNVISVASIDAQNNFSEFSNEGQESVTLSAYGEDIQSYGLGGVEIIASGTSMSTYFVSRELALQISTNKNRTYQQVWADFLLNNLEDNTASEGKTITGKRLKVTIEQNEVETSGPICRSNARFTNPVLTLVEGAFARFAHESFTNNFIKAEKAYIKHHKEIHRLLSTSNKTYSQVKIDFDLIKDVALSLLYQSFTNNEVMITTEHLQKVDAFLISLSKATKNQDLKNEITHIRKYMHVAKGKELKRALIDFDNAGEEDMVLSSEELNIPADDFSAQIINAFGRDAYLVYQSSVSGTVNIQLFNMEGRKINDAYNQTVNKGLYQYALSKQHLGKGIYYVQINFKAKNGKQFNKVLKLSVAQ